MRLPKITENQSIGIEFGWSYHMNTSDRKYAKQKIREQGRHKVTAVKVYEDGKVISVKKYS